MLIAFKLMHIVGLVMLLGVSLTFVSLSLATSSLADNERMDFYRRIFKLSMISSSGLLLSLISGIALWIILGASVMATGGAFHAKLTLVAILIGVFGWMQMSMVKSKSATSWAEFQKVNRPIQIVFALALAIVFAAVLAFR